VADEANIPVTPAAEAAPAPATESAAPAAPARERGFGGGGRGGGRAGFGGGGFGGGRRPRNDNQDKGGDDLMEKVVFINRSAKVVKGGRRFSFSALVVVGDKKGRVGVGLGKASEVADAIRRGGEMARGAMVPISLNGPTIPHEAHARFDGANILLRPASPGTGIIAGKTVRAVLESVGIKDILSKSLGSSNAANVVKATLKALQSLRLREAIFQARGIELKKKETTAVAA
jgi:small subunit ribosomal protein S5